MSIFADNISNNSGGKKKKFNEVSMMSGQTAAGPMTLKSLHNFIKENAPGFGFDAGWRITACYCDMAKKNIHNSEKQKAGEIMKCNLEQKGLLEFMGLVRDYAGKDQKQRMPDEPIEVWMSDMYDRGNKIESCFTLCFTYKGLQDMDPNERRKMEAALSDYAKGMGCKSGTIGSIIMLGIPTIDEKREPTLSNVEIKQLVERVADECRKLPEFVGVDFKVEMSFGYMRIEAVEGPTLSKREVEHNELDDAKCFVEKKDLEEFARNAFRWHLEQPSPSLIRVEIGGGMFGLDGNTWIYFGREPKLERGKRDLEIERMAADIGATGFLYGSNRAFQVAIPYMQAK